jgi:pyruvate/2-oxoglutarate dehydrogenase complex dihydrolipoamide dehydrogenase (E3) component
MAGMAEQLTPDLCVIGGGAAGLSVAAAAATLGVPVVLIEKAQMGGECLNTGCVPSKAMIAAGKRADAFRTSPPFGIKLVRPAVEFAEVNDHIHRVIKAIAPNDSKERFTGLGVRVIEGEARFRDSTTIVVGAEHDRGYEISARRFVIATGSRPLVPPIPGIEQAPYLTNENVFELRELPKHLIVLGGGPVGLELAQAFRRLGSEVTVLDAGPPLGKEDPECAAIVLDAFAREGITIRSGVQIERVRRQRQRIEVVLAGAAGEIIQGTDLLVATGRRPNVDALDLQAARIKHGPNGIAVNNRFRTSNRRVYAIGDVTGLPAFTHSASHQASLLIRHLLFRLPIKMNVDEIPRVTFTDPELAHVGLTDVQARARHGTIRVLRWPYHDNDRAQAERETRGHIKVVANTKGLILGATIVGAAAGEQITTWTLAVSQGLNIRALAEIVVPYPTYTEIGKRAAITFFTPRLTTTWVRRILNLLRWFG